jgi:hypothetical protein
MILWKGIVIGKELNVVKTYKILLTFLEPVEGVTFITANSEEEARTRAEQLFQNRQNLNIAVVEEHDTSAEDQLLMDFIDVKGELN